MQASVVNLTPFLITENKPGLYPGHFQIPPAEKDKMSILHVQDSVFHVYLDMDRGSMTVPVPALKVAESIVADFKSAKLVTSPGEAEPGIFAVNGHVTQKEVETKYAEELKEQRRVQHNWFSALVHQADDDWSRYKQHRMISDTQRFAAKLLGLDREWNLTTIIENIGKCPACTSVVPASAVVCPACRCILNAEAYKKLTFAKD
jgi:hypothetical protein